MSNQKNGLKNRLSGYLLGGVRFALPLALTVFIVGFAVSFVYNHLGAGSDALVRWLFPNSVLTGPLSTVILPLISIIALVGLLAWLGFVSSWPLGNRALRQIDRFFSAIPLAGGIYKATRKISDMVGDARGSGFSRVVFVVEPDTGSRLMAFVAGETVDISTGKKFLSVFIPFAPNPTGGLVKFVPEEVTSDAKMTPSEAWNIVLSMGMLAPPRLGITCPATDADSPCQNAGRAKDE